MGNLMTGNDMIQVDYAIYICNGCKSNRTHYFDKPIIGSNELLVFLHGEHTACGCGFPTCDIKLHIMKA